MPNTIYIGTKREHQSINSKGVSLNPSTELVNCLMIKDSLAIRPLATLTSMGGMSTPQYKELSPAF